MTEYVARPGSWPAPNGVQHPVDLDGPAAPPVEGVESGTWQYRIDALADLDGRPLAEHADVYDALHADLKRRLGEVDIH